MGIGLENAHRALGDAHAAALLYWELWTKLIALPYTTLREITMASQGLAWDARLVFEAALKEQQPPDPGSPGFSLASVFQRLEHEETPLSPKETRSNTDHATVVNLFGQEGTMAQTMPSYEHRTQQVAMAVAVADAFNNGHHASRTY
jgi:hypothetical protein